MPIHRSGCIYCGSPTGSREHAFPAALGGRRVNKRILCHDCNQGFSALDAELVAQLDLFNGLLGVRSDHRDDAKPATITDPRSGTAYQVGVSGKPELREPLVVDGDPSAAGNVSMLFTSEEQVQAWLRAQHANGFDVKMIERSEYQGLRVEPFEASWTFGGDDAFREVGRIVMNFFAHHFPDLARQDGVVALKEFVQGHGRERLVEYDMAAGHRALTPPSRAFAHRVVLVVDHEGRRAHGRLSLFSRYHLTVVLGDIDADMSQTVVIDIDPLAEHAPADLVVDRRDGVGVDLTCAGGTTVELMRAATRDLLSAIERRNWVPFAHDLLARLAPARVLTGDECDEAVAEVLTSARQVLLNILTYIVTKGAARLSEAGAPGELIEVWMSLSQAGDEPGGVTPVTNAIVETLRRRLARHIAGNLEGIRDAETLHDVLCGRTALRVGAEVIDGFWNGVARAQP